MRYRLARSLVPGIELDVISDRVSLRWDLPTSHVVFVLCNPSTATAFKPDNTVTKCGQFAQRWGANLYEVVNVYAYRSTYPTDLDTELAAGRPIGTDTVADDAILAACRGASRVIAAWGNNGSRIGRADAIRALLAKNNIDLEHLGLTNGGYPTHPLARGKKFVPLDREPVVWR
jgi:hypothetical protein